MPLISRSIGKRSPWWTVASLLMVTGATLPTLSVATGRAAGVPTDQPPAFSMLTELYPDGAAAGADRLRAGLASGMDFHTVLSDAERQLVTSTKLPFAYFSIPSEANVASCYEASTDPSTGATLSGIRAQTGTSVWRHAMPEFDQGGGCWANGRPSPAGLSDPAAYASWMNYYRTTKGLDPYLRQSEQQRGYKWMSTCVYAFCPQYAYDLGSDTVLLERNEDEVSGITPGLAMLRGAAAQHGGKQWGLDFSTWRYWNDGPTVYDASGKLVTGWSTSTVKRELYAAYMAGASLVHNEAADYTTGGANGGLNPLGQTVQEFGNFALTRHPDRGSPYVPMALLQSHDSGFEPKFGEWTQEPSKWYGQNPYTAGDTMFASVLGAVYPSYNVWGSIPPGVPWKVTNPDGSINVGASQASYRAALASGADPRRFEPMGSTRYGESLDVITDQASLAAMQRYKVIMLVTGQPVSPSMLATLTQYVQRGGVLVVNAKQLPAGAESLTGLQLTADRGSATAANWRPDGSTAPERSFGYTVAKPTSASVLAAAPNGAPLITRNAYGTGTVYTSTPDYLLDANSSALLGVGQKLLDLLAGSVAKVSVQGPALQYLVNTSGSRTIVTLINTDLSGAAWTGTLSFPAPAPGYTMTEWTSDHPVASSVANGKLAVAASVPGYNVRVFALNAPGGAG
jgi:hypothetical protein